MTNKINLAEIEQISSKEIDLYGPDCRSVLLSGAEALALVKAVRAAKQCEKDFMKVDDGFFTNLVPPQFMKVSKALSAFDWGDDDRP